jgi:ribokinase
MKTPRITVVGSINVDLVARVPELPRPGETVSSTGFAQYFGGKGANQAVAAARLGAEVRMVGAVGRDRFGAQARDNLAGEAVDVGSVREAGAETGTALIFVDDAGETVIVVVPGANARVAARDVRVGGAVLCQLELPDEAVLAAAEQAQFFCLNAAPARRIDVEPDLLVVNALEREVVGDRGRLTAVTLGAEGAVLLEGGAEVARARPPGVDVVDGTAAGDAFTAALLVSLLEGREREESLRRACAAGAIAASRPGAQPSLPTADEVDAILVA